MTITVFGDAERAAWAEANADARADAQWDHEHLCACGRTKFPGMATCVHQDCMSDEEYEAMLDASTGHEIRWIA